MSGDTPLLSALFAAYSLLVLLRPSASSGNNGACRVANLADFLALTTTPVPSARYTPHSTAGYPQGEVPPLYVYAITQDCQLVFARWDQLAQFNELVEVDTRLNYCLPGLVQLHWRTHWYGDDSSPDGMVGTGEARLGLQLLFKRSPHQVCTLPVEFPEENALAGPDLFSYSLRASLPYSSCSYTHSSSRLHRNASRTAEFTLEPELSFMDTLYSDVLYFVDPHSSGPYWAVKQFQLDPRGYFSHLGDFTVRNFAATADGADTMTEQAKDYLLALDLQRRRLYAVHRKRKVASATCAYDLLFRPHLVRVEQCSLRRAEEYGAQTPAASWIERYTADHRINSLSVDGPLILFSELSRREGDRLHTTLLIASRERNDSARCLLEVPYVARFGLIRAATLEELREVRLPTFRSAVQQRRRTHGGGAPTPVPTTPARPASPQPTRWLGTTTAVAPLTPATARKQTTPATTTRKPGPTTTRQPPKTPSPRPQGKSHPSTTRHPKLVGNRTAAVNARPAVAEDKSMLLPVNTAEETSSIEATPESAPSARAKDSSSSANYYIHNNTPMQLLVALVLSAMHRLHTLNA